MSDKVQLIKEEIKKLYNLYELSNDYQRMGACYTILKFIDSLPEESTIEDLEEEIDRCWEGWIDPNPEVKGVDGYLSKDEFSVYARHFAEWQKQKDYKMYAHVPLKDIHDAWQELKKNKPDIENYPAVCFQKGADWQKQKNFEELFKSDMTLFKECYEKGRLDMREEMMKDAVDATILDVDARTIEFGLWPENLLDIKEGDKVKIIIVKEEQQ